ncbi:MULTISPECIES: hypothetical protein [Rhodococcus]|nr:MULTISPECIES: hypothetical protein [Rhodococcus]MDV7246391.1 hypothetical protein [Rhodococcus oxybenzonivorans]MDV7337327.1 hypothetical protein [Rhodococcus oxybenzonivorans]MDV7348053.1 hypothetical protein [Rhodococcus oxybenzonivorans]MDV8031610.1 hypothetical protein [Rhodococcus sp. IEGM 27]
MGEFGLPGAAEVAVEARALNAAGFLAMMVVPRALVLVKWTRQPSGR